jgi:hypothetical protein
MSNPTPTAHDVILINDNRDRVSYVRSDGAVIVTEGYELDPGELTLTTPAVRGGTPATWTVRTGPDGRRA